MSNLYWREPAWMLLGLLPMLWLAAGHWLSRRRALRYADPRLHPWALQRQASAANPLRRAGLLLAWLLLGLAAAGPRSPAWLPPEQDHSNGTLMVVLDLSRSMDAQDLWPSRRRHALQVLQSLVPELAGARTGLVVYAGRPHLLLPPTADRQALTEIIRQLDGLRLPTEGSSLADALALAGQHLQDTEGRRQILLLSDLDLAAERIAPVSDAIRALDRQGIDLLLGTAATEGGAAIPLTDGAWLAQDGRPVLSRLDPEVIGALLAAGADNALSLNTPDTEERLLAALPAAFGQPRLDNQSAVLWQEHFPWLLWPAVLLWLATTLRWRPAAPLGLLGTGLYLLGLLTQLVSLPAQADAYRDAHRALQSGDARRALSLFDSQQGYAARMGSGSSCYRLEDFACSQQAFAEALLSADGDQQRAAALYNLGHSRFQAGDYAGAAGLFADALRYRPDYPAARHNRAFAQALADEVARLADREATGRAGRGPRSAGRTDNAAADARLQLDDESTTALPAADSGAGSRQALLNRGLQFIQLEQSEGDGSRPSWGRYVQGSGSGKGDDTRLWQGLLERAEGFPATPEQPMRIPGVRPW